MWIHALVDEAINPIMTHNANEFWRSVQALLPHWIHSALSKIRLHFLDCKNFEFNRGFKHSTVAYIDTGMF